MDINQKLLNALITRHIDLMRYETSIREQVFAKMGKMQDDVWGFVLSGSLKKVEHIITQGYELLLKMWDVLPVFNAEMAWLSATLGGLAVAYKLKDKIIPFAQNKLKDLADKFTIGGLTLPESVAKQRDDLVRKLKQIVRFSQIDDILPSKEEIQSIFNGFKNRAKTLSKTWINSAIHTAHDAFAKVNPMIKGFRHVSTLDGKTSSVCTHRNGLLWDKKHKPIGHAELFKRPPLHPNCRSKMVYVYDLKKPFDGMTGADWVKSRSLKELQDQFGVGIGKMLFDGEIDLADALDGLKPLTLAELKGKVAQQKYGTTLSRSVFELPDVPIFLRELPKHLPRIQKYAKKHNLTETDYTALFLYSRLGKSMNMAAYQADKIPKKQILAWQELNQATNEALDKLPDYAGTVTRRIKPYPNFAQQHQIGAWVTYDNLTSSSLDGSVFKGLPDYKITLTIQSKHGKLIEQISALPQQREVLFKMGTQFKVLDYQEKGDEIWVNLMET